MSRPTAEAMRAEASANPEKLRWWEVAFHEAGHCVASVAMAREYPDLLYLNDAAADSSHAGRNHFRGAGLIVASEWPYTGPDPEMAALVAALAQDQASVLAAGELSRSLALGITPDIWEQVTEILEPYECEHSPGSDEAALAEMVQHMRPAEAEDWLEAQMERSLHALRTHWPMVELVADALFERRRLTRDDLWNLIPPT